MRAHIVHRLTYRYDAPITLGEHRLCLKPRGQAFSIARASAHQTARATATPGLLASGDEILSFIGSTDQLIEATSLVETRPAPPLSLSFNGMEPPLPYPRGQLNGDLLGLWTDGFPTVSTNHPPSTSPRRR